MEEVFKIVTLFNVANIKIQNQSDFNTEVEKLVRKGKTLNEAIRVLLLNRNNIPYAKAMLNDGSNLIKDLENEDSITVLIPYIELMEDIESNYIYK